jgi:hypothetical protein
MNPIPLAETHEHSIVVIGEHPRPPHALASCLISEDGFTAGLVQHRSLIEKEAARQDLVAYVKRALKQHHLSPDALQRWEASCEAMKRLGFDPAHDNLGRFPRNETTRKGNLAEVVLADYLAASSQLSIPVYRLRYNPNVDQSMKGDDVLAFDLDSNPVRVVVGEAKFRGKSSTSSVNEITKGLIRSYKAGAPASLQFVAERLYESGEKLLARRVQDCAWLFASGNLQIDYVGMLLSDIQSARRVANDTCSSLRRLAIISLGIVEPDSLIAPCYEGLV